MYLCILSNDWSERDTLKGVQKRYFYVQVKKKTFKINAQINNVGLSED